METIEQKIDRMLMLQARHALAVRHSEKPGIPDPENEKRVAKRWATMRDKLRREILALCPQDAPDVPWAWKALVEFYRLDDGSTVVCISRRKTGKHNYYKNPTQATIGRLSDLVLDNSICVEPWAVCLGWRFTWYGHRGEP